MTQLLNYNTLTACELIDIYIEASEDEFKAYLQEKHIPILMKECVYEGRSRNKFSKDIIKYKEDLNWHDFYLRINRLYTLLFTNNNSKIADHYCDVEHLMELKILQKHYNILPSVRGANRLAYNGNLYIIEWLAEFLIFPDSNGAYDAVRNEHMFVLNWLKENIIFPEQDYALCYAIKKGLIKILDWYFSMNILPKNGSDACDNAIEKNQIDSLKWLIAHNILPNATHADYAAEESRIDMLDFLETQNVLPSINAYKMARKLENEEVIEWLSRRGIFE